MNWWETLFNNLPLTILLILAVIFCGADLIKAIKVWKDKRKEDIQTAVDKRTKETELNNTLTDIQKTLKNMEKRFGDIETKVQDLTNSDMHDIKSWIVEQYLKFYVHLGWIDAFSADTLDHRYQDYKKEGGNSYIDTLMDQLHTLPMDPELSIHKDRNKK